MCCEYVASDLTDFNWHVRGHIDGPHILEFSCPTLSVGPNSAIVISRLKRKVADISTCNSRSSLNLPVVKLVPPLPVSKPPNNGKSLVSGQSGCEIPPELRYDCVGHVTASRM